MTWIRRLVLPVLLLVPSTAGATWSIVAVDRATGRVVIASATCVNADDDFLKNIQAVVVPGKGIAACQASVDGTHANQMLVFEALQKGTDPARIIELLSADPAFQSRQFGIVDLQGRSAGHSGLTNGYVSQDLQGRVPGTDIFYSIQGNILRPGEVVPHAVQAFLGAGGLLTDRVMAAMEAADASGGDSRCSCPPPDPAAPAPTIPCATKTAHVAYILMAEKADTSGDSHSNGQYALYLSVSQPGHGPNEITPGENLNPVKTLRMRYDAWRKTHGGAPTAAGRGRAGGQADEAGLGSDQRGRGGQRGRGPVQAMTLGTTAWHDGGVIPVKYTQAGEEVSPPLTWGDPPEGVTSFVLIVHDLDAPTGSGTDDVLQWMAWNIPPSARGLPERVPQGPELSDGMRQISVTGPYYRGPAAPASGPPHHYVFELYALDTAIDVPSVGASPADTRAAVVAAMAGHVRGKAVLVGTWRRVTQGT